MGLSENVVYPFLPNGFADHYPYEKLLFHWEYTLHFQTNPFGSNFGSIKKKTALSFEMMCLHLGRRPSLENLFVYIFV